MKNLDYGVQMYLFLWLSNFLIQLCGLRLLHGRFACFLVYCFRFCFSFFVLLLLFSFFLSSSLFFRLTSCFFLLTARFFLLTARFLLLSFLSVTRILLKMSTPCKTTLLTSEKNKQGHYNCSFKFWLTINSFPLCLFELGWRFRLYLCLPFLIDLFLSLFSSLSTGFFVFCSSSIFLQKSKLIIYITAYNVRLCYKEGNISFSPEKITNLLLFLGQVFEL